MAKTYQDYEPGYENKDYMFNWFFHFNPYTGDWNAVPREQKLEYWNNFECENVVKSKSFLTLLEILNITKGDVSNLDEKLNVNL